MGVGRERENEREREREREKERDIVWLPLVSAPTGDQTCNLGVCPDQESNQQPLGGRHSNQPSHPVRAKAFLNWSLSVTHITSVGHPSLIRGRHSEMSFLLFQ